MKVYTKRLATCLLTGTIILTTGVTPAMADTAERDAVSQASGLSLALADVELQAEDSAETAAQTLVGAEAEMLSGEESGGEYANIGVVEADSYVNVRDAASTDGEIVGKMENHSVAFVESEEDGWYKITSGSISGYVLAEYLTVGDAELIDSVKTRVATVTADALKVREEASTDAAVLLTVAADTQLTVVDEDTAEWVHVETSDTEGYVAAEYVTVEDTYLYAKTPEEVSGGTAVASYALQFVGNPYVWGGTSLTNGADCSGFILSVYAHYGVSLPHSSAALRSVGTEVDYSEAKPGDIICYSGHVALYIGGGQIVHAANEKTGITVSSATYNTILTVRRIFE
ncbi:MAG: C40 family peptidase [Lachnospiraceae bacterium]|nr:C40 family peptidase [Lachnospiraceae bacterium]